MSDEPYPSERPSDSNRTTRSDGASATSGNQGGYDPYQPTQPYQGGYAAYQPAQPYQGGYAAYQSSYQVLEGEKAAQLALIFGIVGFFAAGIVLGPLAIWQSTKAERLGARATAGKILGWIVTVINVLAVLGFIVFFTVIIAGLGASAGLGS